MTADTTDSVVSNRQRDSSPSKDSDVPHTSAMQHSQSLSSQATQPDWMENFGPVGYPGNKRSAHGRMNPFGAVGYPGDQHGERMYEDFRNIDVAPGGRFTGHMFDYKISPFGGGSDNPVLHNRGTLTNVRVYGDDRWHSNASASCMEDDRGIIAPFATVEPVKASRSADDPSISASIQDGSVTPSSETKMVNGYEESHVVTD